MTKNTFAWLLGSVALLGSLATGAQAQTVYRIVGADGKVTFSDKPPENAQQGKVATTGVGAAAANPSSALPLELRPIVAKYPVVLYTTTPCAPCETGRTILSVRGVPFTERTVTSPEDRASMLRLMGDDSMPVLTVGSQRIKGLQESEWIQYLDAAGYPKTSVLPASYKNAPATPLVAVQKAPAPQASEASKPAQVEAPKPPPPPTGPSPSNPAGITF